MLYNKTCDFCNRYLGRLLGRSVGAPPDRPTHPSGRCLWGSASGMRSGPGGSLATHLAKVS